MNSSPSIARDHGGAVGGEQLVLEIGDQHEGIRAFDDVGQQFPLGERVVHATLQRLVELAEAPLALAQRALGQDPLRRFRARAEHPRDLAGFIADG